MLNRLINLLTTMSATYVFGVDFGTDSVRSILINTSTGEEIAASSFTYPRWKQGLYCDPSKNEYRQHPLDHMEGIEFTIKDCLKKSKNISPDQVKAIGIGTTGSTPGPVNKDGTPLALLSEFKENPNAMFVLWKDHTSIKEADKINAVNLNSSTDYLQYVGGVYSSEWFWAKMLHIAKEDPQVASAAYTWMEHSDWVPYLLCGTGMDQLKRNICAAGHKGLWAKEFNGLPEWEFFNSVDPYLGRMAKTFPGDFVTSVEPVGKLSNVWAKKLGLQTDVVISAGIIDAHAGAVGAAIKPGEMVKIIGTSTCDIMVASEKDIGGNTIKGICGQVYGSVIPGYTGLEAGQSAFGDLFNWYVSILNWSNNDEKENDHEKNIAGIFKRLSEEAKKLPLDNNAPVTIDWFNGRRTPDANQNLTGSITNLSIASNAAVIFRSLVEGACFGAKKINDCFTSQGIKVSGVTATGGIAKKSEYIMQTLSDILQLPIKVHKSENTCAIGAAINASIAAGIFDNMEEALKKLGQGNDRKFTPNEKLKEFYKQREVLYENAGIFMGKNMECKF